MNIFYHLTKGVERAEVSLLSFENTGEDLEGQYWLHQGLQRAKQAMRKSFCSFACVFHVLPSVVLLLIDSVDMLIMMPS